MAGEPVLLFLVVIAIVTFYVWKYSILVIMGMLNWLVKLYYYVLFGVWSSSASASSLMKVVEDVDQKRLLHERWHKVFDWVKEQRRVYGVTVGELLRSYKLPDTMENQYMFYHKDRPVPLMTEGSPGKLVCETLESSMNLKIQPTLVHDASWQEKAQDKFYTYEKQFKRAGVYDVLTDDDDDAETKRIILVPVIDDDKGTTVDLEMVQNLLNEGGNQVYRFVVARNTKHLHENPSCVRVGDSASFGTGFLFHDTYGITAKHVLVTNDDILYWHPQKRLATCGKFGHTDKEGYDKVGTTLSKQFEIPNLDVGFFYVEKEALRSVKAGEDSVLKTRIAWPNKDLTEEIELVKKHGAVTGVTEGRIVRTKSAKSFLVQSTVIGPFALCGDSGSLVLDHNNHVVGIVSRDFGLSDEFGEQILCVKTSAFLPYLRDIIN